MIHTDKKPQCGLSHKIYNNDQLITRNALVIWNNNCYGYSLLWAPNLKTKGHDKPQLVWMLPLARVAGVVWMLPLARVTGVAIFISKRHRSSSLNVKNFQKVTHILHTHCLCGSSVKVDFHLKFRRSKCCKNRLAAPPSAAALPAVTWRQYSRPKIIYF